MVYANAGVDAPAGECAQRPPRHTPARLASSGGHLEAVLPHTTAPRSLADDLGISTETALGECLPDDTGVLAAGELLVGKDDGISSV